MNITYNNKLLDKVFNSYLYLTIIATLTNVLGNIINGIIAGNFVGSIGLAAFGYCSPLIYAMIAITYIFSNGGSIKCANHFDNKEKVFQTFTVTTLVALIVGIIITIIFSITCGEIATILGATGATVIPAKMYILGIGIGTIPNILNLVLINHARIDGYPKVGLIAATIIVIFTIILDLIFVLFLKEGLFGLGFATSLAQFIAFIFLISHFLSKKSSFKFTKNFNLINELKEIVPTGIPSALNQVYNMVRTMITNGLGSIIGGLIFVGALSVQSSIYMLLCTVGVGIGTTTMALGGIFYGENDKSSLESLLKLSVKYATIIITIIAIILIIFAPSFVKLFSHDPSIFDTAIRGIRIFALSLPLSALSYIFMNFYNCTQKLKYSNYIGFGHSFFFLVVPAIIGTYLIGGDGIWISFVLSEIFTLMGLFLLVRREIGYTPKSIKDFVIVEKDNLPKEDVLSVSIDSEEKLLYLVSNLDELLGENNLSKKLKLKISLIIEEIGKNILKHSYESNENKNLDIRIKYKNTDEIIIYFQDNGVPFDLNNFKENKIDEQLNLSENNIQIGLNIVKNISGDTTYTRKVNLNNNKIILPIDKN